MRATFIFSTLLLAAAANAIHVTGPDGKTLKQCSQAAFKVGGATQLDVQLVDADDECGDPIKAWKGIFKESTVHWTVDLPVGKQVLMVVDETGVSDAEEWTDHYTIVAGDDTSCLNALVATPGGGAPPASTGGDPATGDGAAPGGGSSPGGDGGAANAEGSTGAAGRTTATPLALALVGVAAIVFAL